MRVGPMDFLFASALELNELQGQGHSLGENTEAQLKIINLWRRATNSHFNRHESNGESSRLFSPNDFTDFPGSGSIYNRFSSKISF